MSTRSRIVLFGLAIAVLLLAVIISTTGGDDESERTASSPPESTPVATTAPSEAEPQETTTRTPKPTPEPPLRVVVKGGEAVGGVKELEVDKGDRARFTVESDVEEDVHVHGYDIEKPVAPGQPAEFDFKTSIDGILEVELEHAGIEVLSLRVNP